MGSQGEQGELSCVISGFAGHGWQRLRLSNSASNALPDNTDLPFVLGSAKAVCEMA